MNTLYFNQQKQILSTLWIFVTLNYLYCDVISLMDANLLQQYLTGEVEGLQLNHNFLLGASLLMELPILMILLSKILPPIYNCWVNIVASSIKTLVMIATLFIGTTTSYYLFFASIEITTTIFITGYCWYWKKNIF